MIQRIRDGKSVNIYLRFREFFADFRQRARPVAEKEGELRRRFHGDVWVLIHCRIRMLWRGFIDNLRSAVIPSRADGEGPHTDSAASSLQENVNCSCEVPQRLRASG